MVVSNKPNSPKINIAIDGQQIEQVTSYYMYLGSLITEDGRSEKEIKRRIMIARSTFTNMITLDLTRFNKIATQGAPQMAVDKEANSLSRVYSYYSKFNLRLFYV